MRSPGKILDRVKTAHKAPPLEVAMEYNEGESGRYGTVMIQLGVGR